MNRTIGPERSLEIIADLANAALDINGLTAKYGLDREDLARWVLSERTQHILAGLCVLTDYQTQLLLSHYRVTAVTRLVEMVQPQKETDEEEKDENGVVIKKGKKSALSPDLVRKACVDLLRLNMGRIESLPPGSPPPLGANLQALRKFFYGDLTKKDESEESERPETAAAETAEPTGSTESTDSKNP